MDIDLPADRPALAERRVRLAVGGSLLAYLLALAALLPVRFWDQGEFEHLQLAWLISQGAVRAAARASYRRFGPPWAGWR
ncbi:MAG TPA: hypothetical protein VGH36_01615 [Acetobacteraceae bacterium]|jgi:hypothetical protein